MPRRIGGIAVDGCNPAAPHFVREHLVHEPWRLRMSFLKRLFSSNTPEPTQRVRVCVECGMPVADHKEWCSIRRGHAEMERRKAESE